MKIKNAATEIKEGLVVDLRRATGLARKCGRGAAAFAGGTWAVITLPWSVFIWVVRASKALLMLWAVMTIYLGMAGRKIDLVDARDGGVYRDRTAEGALGFVALAYGGLFNAVPRREIVEPPVDFEPILGEDWKDEVISEADIDPDAPTLPPAERKAAGKQKAPAPATKPEKAADDIFNQYGLKPLGDR